MPSWKTAGLRFAVLAVLLAGLVIPLTTAEAEPPSVTLQLLNVSDWHAQIDPLPGGIGGAAAISAYWQRDRAEYPRRTLSFTAGDSIGASPPLSNFFDEEPAIIAMRLMGIKVNTFGNHEFDRGTTQLQKIINHAAQPRTLRPGKPFSYVSANLKNRKQELDGVRDYRIYRVGGIPVAVIGITNPEAPTLVFPGNFGDIVPQDPVKRAMYAKEQAAAEGAKVFILIVHMGVTGFDERDQPFGPLVDFANSVSGFHAIMGDHTDVQFDGIINNQLVVENRSKGLTYARTFLTVRSKTGLLLDREVEFVTPTVAGITPDPAIEEAMAPYREQLEPIFSRLIGQADTIIPRSDNCGRSDGRLCESKIGNLITDAMRKTYETDFAFTNSGGIRSNLTCPTTDLPTDFCPAFTPPPFPITRGQVQEVLPFGNVVATVDMTGAELKTALENGVSVMPGANGRFTQVSGLCYTYDIHAAVGSRITSVVYQAEDGTCTATPVDLSASATYNIAQNDFTANGGDGYPNVASRMVTRDVMVNVVADYIAANSPVNPEIQGRITCTSSGTTNCPTPPP